MVYITAVRTGYGTLNVATLTDTLPREGSQAQMTPYCVIPLGGRSRKLGVGRAVIPAGQPETRRGHGGPPGRLATDRVFLRRAVSRACLFCEKSRVLICVLSVCVYVYSNFKCIHFKKNKTLQKYLDGEGICSLCPHMTLVCDLPYFFLCNCIA